MHFKLIHRGKPLSIDETPTTVGQLRSRVAATLDVPAQNVRLIVKGAMLLPAKDEALLSEVVEQSQSVLVLATSSKAIETLNATKPDVTLRPLHAKPSKYVATPRKTAHVNTTNRFGSISALPNLPNSERAQQILEELASDRGFLFVMAKKNWSVGVLREMPPDGRVGVDPVCVLGLNTNHGQTISLRLRTDDMQGFRSMSTIRHVFAHELAHNEISEHDDSFKELMRWIEKTAEPFNWRAHGKRLDESWHAPAFSASASRRDPRNNQGTALGGRAGPSRLLSTTSVQESSSPPSTVAEDIAVEESEASSHDTGVVAAVEETSQESSMVGQASTTMEIRGTDSDCSHTSGDTEGSEGHEEDASTPLSKLQTIGFPRALAVLALRESGQCVAQAVDWVVSHPIESEIDSNLGEREAKVFGQVRNAMNSLASCLNENQLVSTLDILHLYMSNVLRNPSIERFSRINNENAMFRRGVGAFEDALQILRIAGFRLEGNHWQFSSLDVSSVWMTKSLLEERLIREIDAVMVHRQSFRIFR